MATITRAVVSSRDHVGTDQSEQADASAHCGIPIAAITTSPGCLGRRLIENPDVGLMGIGCRVSAHLRHVKRPECGVAFVDQTPCKIAVSAIAGAVISRVDQEERPGIRRRPPRNWRVAPKQIFSIEVKAVRYIPKIHGNCPTEIASPLLDERLSTSTKKVAKRSSKKAKRLIQLSLDHARRLRGEASEVGLATTLHRWKELGNESTRHHTRRAR